MFQPQKFWCGSQETYDHVIEASAKADKLQASGAVLDESGMMQMLSVDSGVGTIAITGALIQGDAGFMQMFGVTGYNDIKRSLVQALSDNNVRVILLDINSGGGQVSGVTDLSSFIQTVSSVKPVHTFSDGSMCSAAYWLGVNGESIHITDTTSVGSIGALQVHTEYSQMLAHDGVKKTIIRSGAYKAAGNSIEPLSAQALEQMQTEVDDVYGVFLPHVAAARKMPMSTADASVGQGKVFMGKRAVALGLADYVANYETVVAELAAKYSKTTQRKSASNSINVHNPKNSVQGTDMKRVTVSASQLQAAITAGLDATSFELEAPPADVTAIAAAAALAVETPTIDVPAVVADVVAAPKLEVNSEDALLSTFLRAELRDTQASLTASAVALADATRQLQTLKDSAADLTAIARKSVASMKVAMNESAASADTLEGTALVAEHQRMTDVFKSKFKVGGVAAAASTEEAKPQVAQQLNPAFVAMLKPAK